MIPEYLCKGLVEEYRSGTTKQTIFYRQIGASKEEMSEFNKNHRECFKEYEVEHLKNYHAKYSIDTSHKDKDSMSYKEHLKKAGVKLNKYDQAAFIRN